MVLRRSLGEGARSPEQPSFRWNDALGAVATLVLILAGGACAPRSVAAVLSPIELVEPSGRALTVAGLASSAKWTVLIFFSRDCHCLTVHEPRVAKLADALRSQGVRFFWVDSERRASVEADAVEARRRGLTFPVLIDSHARLADALGAEYATYSVVIDSNGAVRYRGGIDNDKTHLHDDATLYLGDALADLVEGREPRAAESNVLGCALQKW